ncbi:MAG TPA: hypothetical protein VFL14_08975 [Xanthomonadales bacterium]|nr:hypothetical protein [Xanthomonadales bacterium]
MFAGRVELATFYRGVQQRAASAAGIEDVEWKSIAELRQELEAGYPKVATMLRDFIDAYDSWYSIHEGLERVGSGRLSMEQQLALARAIERRDAARRVLISELNK